jgi:hypothetical protein
MVRIEKRKARATGMAETIRLGAAVTAVSMLALSGRPAQADIAVVQQDATPIVSAPGVGGQVLTRVDAGFALTVLGREGAWLKVASPRLQLGGELWVPAERVGDIVATPDEAPLSDDAAPMTITPQFRITSRMDGVTTASPGAAASIGSKGSTGDSTAAASSTSSGGGAARATSTATPTAAGQGTATPNNTAASVGDPTPPAGNAVPAQGNPTPAATGNPMPAGGNATPALGNPTPAPGNPTPAGGNSTPAPGNSMAGFGNSRATTQ